MLSSLVAPHNMYALRGVQYSRFEALLLLWSSCCQTSYQGLPVVITKADEHTKAGADAAEDHQYD